MNEALKDMFDAAQSDIRKELPNFDRTKLLAGNMDQFHKNPAHQQHLVQELKNMIRAEIVVGGRTFSLVATPVFNDENERLGTAVEWNDRTLELQIEQEVEDVVTSAAQGDLSTRLVIEGKTGFFRNVSEGINQLAIDVQEGLYDYKDEIIAKVKMAAKAKVREHTDSPLHKMNIDPKLNADAVLSKRSNKHFKTTDKLIAIGASTGGTEAFSAPFAKRMNTISAMTVFEAQDGQQILSGHVYIAPGNQHLVVERNGAQYVRRLNDGPRVNRHKPSVDVMFRSVAQNVGPNAIGVILTGMGDDGARGLLEMKEAGAPTMAQDEASSVVWGMPGEAVKLGAADEELDLMAITPRLLTLAR